MKETTARAEQLRTAYQTLSRISVLAGERSNDAIEGEESDRNCSEPHRRPSLASALDLVLSVHSRASRPPSRMLDQHGLEDNDLTEGEPIDLIGIAPRGLQTGLGGPVRLRRWFQQAQRWQRR